MNTHLSTQAPGNTAPVRASRAPRARRNTVGNHHPRRHAVRVVALLVMAAVGVSTPMLLSNSRSSAISVPTRPNFTKPMEPLAKYESEAGCSPWVKPGTAKLAALLRRTYPGISIGTDAQCGSRPNASSHDDGRAIDWMTNVNNPTQRAQAKAFLDWLLKDNYQMARRLGVMYVIWDNQMFRLYNTSRGWATYKKCPSSGSATKCHRDHVHISLTRAGASGTTSFWSSSSSGSDSVSSASANKASSVSITPRLLYTADTTWRNVSKGQAISIGGDAATPGSTLQMHIRKVRVSNGQVTAVGSFKPYLSPAKANSKGLWIKRYLVGIDHQVFVKSSDGKVSKTLLVTVRQ